MNKKYISSVQNPIIKNVVQLQKKKSARKKQGLFVIEGIRSVSEVPDMAEITHYIATSEELLEEIGRIQTQALVLIVTEEIYKNISDTQAPQGIMAIAKMPHQSLEQLDVVENGFYVILENLQDPGNLGTIIRSSHAFGASGVLLTKGCVDLYSPKVVRSTMSSLFRIPVVLDYEIEEYMDYLSAKGVSLYATNLSECAQSLCDITFANKVALIMGNEGAGISETVKSQVDQHLIIPMPGGAESLNASVATSICLYEVMKQRR